jgi:hypothetical protein
MKCHDCGSHIDPNEDYTALGSVLICEKCMDEEAEQEKEWEARVS